MIANPADVLFYTVPAMMEGLIDDLNVLETMMYPHPITAAIVFILIAAGFGVTIWLDEPKQTFTQFQHVECADGLSGFVDIYGRKFCAARPVQ